MLGLRRLDGIAGAELARLLARGARGAARRAVIVSNVEAGLLEERTDGTIRLTRRGLLLADEVIRELL